MRGHDAIRPSTLAPIVGAVLDGLHEGRAERMSAAERLAAHSHDGRAGAAIRRACDGGEGARFQAMDGAVRHLRRAEAAGAG